MKKTLVFGLGLSGRAAIELLKKKGSCYLFCEDNQNSLDDYCSKNSNSLVFDPSKSTLAEARITDIVVSPGITPTHPILREATENGISIKTEFDLALEYHTPKNLILVTGTNGKSSVCDMMGHILKMRGIPYFLGGNIGRPCCEFVQNKAELVILELSSYQLYYAHNIPPAIGIWTNFAFDHQDWHRTMDAYFQAKLKLIEACNFHGKSYFIGNSVLKYFKYSFFSNVLTNEDMHDGIIDSFALDSSTPSSWPAHQRQNAYLCLKALESLHPGSQRDSRLALESYQPLRFRFQEHASVNGHRIINDSKSTNLHSSLAAVASLKENEAFYLLLGGAGKGENFSKIVAANTSLRHVYCYGRDGERIFNQLPTSNKTLSSTLNQAIESVVDAFYKKPATILFSPGCASFDEFANYLERGETFENAARKLSAAIKAKPATI